MMKKEKKRVMQLKTIFPEGGEGGGYVIAEGSPRTVSLNPESITGRYLKLD
jgi:excinuclease UvrABC ATPase subunit